MQRLKLLWVLAALLIAVVQLPQSAAAAVTLYDGRWFGRAPEDACGQSWAMDVNVRSGKVTGRFWRGGVLYDVYGQVDADGRMTSARGGKSSREFGIAAPRFLQFDAVFLGDTASGSYGVAGSGGIFCQSPLELRRTEQ